MDSQHSGNSDSGHSVVTEAPFPFPGQQQKRVLDRFQRNASFSAEKNEEVPPRVARFGVLLLFLGWLLFQFAPPPCIACAAFTFKIQQLDGAVDHLSRIHMTRRTLADPQAYAERRAALGRVQRAVDDAAAQLSDWESGINQNDNLASMEVSDKTVQAVNAFQWGLSQSSSDTQWAAASLDNTTWRIGYTSVLPFLGADVSATTRTFDSSESFTFALARLDKVLGYKIRVLDTPISGASDWEAKLVPTSVGGDGARNIEFSVRPPRKSSPVEVTVYWRT